MRRPHPYLAISLVCAAVVLVTLAALACPARAERGTTPVGPRQTPEPPTPEPEPTCLPYVHGQVVWPGSPECARYGDDLNVPTQERLEAIKHFTTRILSADLQTGALTTDVPLGVWGDVIGQARQMTPLFYDRSLYGVYAVPPGWTPNCYTHSYCGCAWGVGSWPPKIDASRPAPHVEQLVSWETVNAALGRLNRSDLWDGTYVSSVVTRVGQQLGGWAE